MALGGNDSSGDVIWKPVFQDKRWRVLPTELLLVKQLLGQIEVVDEKEVFVPIMFDQLTVEERDFSSATTLNQKLVMDANLPPNITDGHPVQIIKIDYSESFGDNLKKCFANVPEDIFALIVISENLWELLIKILERINCKHKKNLIALAVRNALKSFGRPTAKTHSLRSPINKADMKRWISGERGEDMIVTDLLANGFESEFVITIGCNTIYWSRSSALTFAIYGNLLVLLLPIIIAMCRDHQCGNFSSGCEIMDLRSPMDVIGM